MSAVKHDLTSAAACPHDIALPLTGLCGGGSSGGTGGLTVGLLSVFLLVSFLWVFGEELEELLELVTVSPELHATREACMPQLQPNNTRICVDIFYKRSFKSGPSCTCFLDT